jgi:hypothetical protein
MSAGEPGEGFEFYIKIFEDVMLVIDVVSGIVVPDCIIRAPGIRPGTKIVSQLSGTTGGPGRYLLSRDQTPGVAGTWYDFERWYKHSTSDAELRDWYLTRLDQLLTAGQRSSGADDWQAAQQEFPGRLKGEADRERVRALRRELAPHEWQRKGRPRGSNHNQ